MLSLASISDMKAISLYRLNKAMKSAQDVDPPRYTPQEQEVSEIEITPPIFVSSRLSLITRIASLILLLISLVLTLMTLALPSSSTELSVLTIRPDRNHKNLGPPMNLSGTADNESILDGSALDDPAFADIVGLEKRSPHGGLFGGLRGPTVWVGVVRKYR